MNNILISNPFLFRPESPMNSEENQETSAFIEYTKLQFEEAWEKSIITTTEPNIENINLLSDEDQVDSPLTNISLSIEQDNLFQEIDPMGDYPDFEDSMLFDADIDAVLLNNGIGDDFLNQSLELENFYPEDVADVFEKDKEKDTSSMVKSMSQEAIIPTLSTVASMDFLSQIMVCSDQSSNNIMLSGSGAEESTSTDHVNTPFQGSSSRGGHQRKAPVGQRMIAQSPYYVDPTPPQEEVEETEEKPDIQALGINNGQQRQGRKRSISTSSSNINDASSSKKMKKKKYEEEDISNPSIRNAKAAKMNRDKKKREFENLKNENIEKDKRINNLEQNEKSLESRLEEALKYKELYLQEKKKNNGAQWLGKEMTNLKAILESIVPSLTKTFDGSWTVEFPEAYNQYPAQLHENGQIEAYFPVVAENIDVNQQMTSSSTLGSAFGIGISPNERKIVVNHDPLNQ